MYLTERKRGIFREIVQKKINYPFIEGMRGGRGERGLKRESLLHWVGQICLAGGKGSKTSKWGGDTKKQKRSETLLGRKEVFSIC